MINQSKLSRGFSLIELMIVVAIIGMLSAISIGFYGDYVTDARRTDGRSALTTTSAALEKCKALYGAYNNAACAAVIPATSDEGYYTIARTTNTATAFVLTASGAGSQATDAECLTMRLSNAGIKDGTPVTNECW
jgi:type IV pilus assembly protein PilE